VLSHLSHDLYLSATSISSSYLCSTFLSRNNRLPPRYTLFPYTTLFRSEITVICEGIIDAMSWETLGYPALAVGGASISKEQIDIIRRGGVRKLYLAGDNDEQGRRLNEQIARALRWDVE